MDETILVKTGEGRRVLTPRGQDVPGGAFKVNKNDPYWARALRAGDLVTVTPETVPVSSTASAFAKKDDK